MSNPFALDTPAPAPATTPAVAPATVAAPVPAPPAATPGGDVDPFDDPAAQRPRGPRLREMYGRLLLVIPTKLEENRPTQFKNPDGTVQTQDRMTADVVVLDGPPINYGGRPEEIPPIPHDKVGEIPFRQRAMFISAAGLISQCREALAKKVSQGRPGMVLGRLTKGQDTGKGNPPWILTPATDADKAIGRSYLQTVDPFA